MPIRTLVLPPEIAFTVDCGGETIPIYHCYEDDDFDKRCEYVYTADIKEGIRNGDTDASSRNDYWIDIREVYDMVEHLLSDFEKARVELSLYWTPKTHSLVLSLAIQNGLVSFDDEGRVTIHEIKEVSNG
jgi:hypothetical protein